MQRTIETHDAVSGPAEGSTTSRRRANADVDHSSRRAAAKPWWAMALLTLLAPSAPALAADTVPHSAPTSTLTYDARIVGLAGAAVAAATGGAASLHNPALLSNIKQRAGTLTFTPYLVKLAAPFRFGNGKLVQKESGVLFGPFAQLGLALRLHPRIVVGMNGFVTGAAGGTFTKVPLNAFSPDAQRGQIGNVHVGQFAGELQVPVAVEVTPWLSLGGAYRLTQAYTFADVALSGGAKLASVSLRGLHVSGWQVGAYARLGRGWRLGAGYRSAVALDLSGSRRVYPNDPIGDTQVRGYRSPHQIRAGATYSPSYLPLLLLAVEGHTELYRKLDARERNTFGGSLGAEYTLLPWLLLRTGFGAASQPVTEANAAPIAPPPGVGYSLSTGAGFAVREWHLDVAAAYAVSGRQVPGNADPGRYAAEGFVGSVSATYTL